jgi:NADPH2:quinone reductase
MRAFQLLEIGSPPVLRDVPQPAPGPGEVLVRIGACGLNFADLLMIDARYQDKPVLPQTLGMELAGTVEALGAGVTGLNVGDRVACYSGKGGLAEYGVFPASSCLTLADAMDLTDAAGFLIAYGTSHLALDHLARLRPGETVLVLGAAGGAGLTAVEIAAKMGARVIACARGADKLQVARDAGAQHVIDSDDADLRVAVKALGGADVVYDPIGEPLFTAALKSCKPGARYLVIGFAGGTVPQIPANYILVKNITVYGFWWGGYASLAPDVLTGSLRTLFDWYGTGRLTPHVSHVLPLDRAAEGLEMIRRRKATGKVVITP